MISSLEALKAINARRDDAIVVAVTETLRMWSSISHHRDLDLDISDCTDRASAVGLGVSLAQPYRRVMVLDCDSALRTSPGSLVTIANATPKNLIHFLFEDGTYTSTNGESIPGLDRIDFTKLAESAGYLRTYQFDDLEELVLSVGDVLDQTGPTFVSLKVSFNVEMPDYPRRTTGESLRAVKQTLERETMAHWNS